MAFKVLLSLGFILIKTYLVVLINNTNVLFQFG